MLPDRVSNPGPLTYESGALPIALHSPARNHLDLLVLQFIKNTELNEFRMNYRFEKNTLLHFMNFRLASHL